MKFTIVLVKTLENDSIASLTKNYWNNKDYIKYVIEVTSRKVTTQGNLLHTEGYANFIDAFKSFINLK